jgi:hypothetical protein
MNRTRTYQSAVIAAVSVLALSGCVSDGPDKDSAQGKKQIAMEDSQAQAEKLVPYPAKEMSYPLTRQNLAERLKRMNDPNHISYVYQLSYTGEPINYMVIKGQLTYGGQQLNPSDAVIDACSNASEYCPQLVEGPGDDNVYGPGGDYWFGFTAAGVMVTFTGQFLQSDAPLTLAKPVPDLTPKQ